MFLITFRCAVFSLSHTIQKNFSIYCVKRKHINGLLVLEVWSAIFNLNKQAKLSYCRGPTISYYVPKVHYKIEKANTRYTLIYRLSGKICLCCL